MASVKNAAPPQAELPNLLDLPEGLGAWPAPCGGKHSKSSKQCACSVMPSLVLWTILRAAMPARCAAQARESEACTGLERLEDLVRQFVGQAPTHMFVQTLLVLDAADRHAAERARSQGASRLPYLLFAGTEG